MSLQRSTLLTFILAATLFLIGAARAENAPAASVLTPTEQALLQRYDTNRDGVLDETELANAHEAMRAPVKTRLARAGVLYARLLRKFDPKQTGKLDPAAQAEAVAFLKAKAPRVYQALLRRFDRDGDGQLEAGETAEMFDVLSRVATAVKAPAS
jgi:Ca2+-binding EF-hand superfamily protein